MIERVEFGGWPNCIRIYNSEIELIVTTDVGPRIVRAGFIGRQNFLYLVPEHLGKSGGAEWQIYGGHRLWHAPEAIPRSYAVDNGPVAYSVDGDTLILTQEKERSTGLVKAMEITLSPHRNEVAVVHRIVNMNLWEIELAAWALSVLTPGGRAIVPQEPYGAGDDYLLPARPLVLWQYTKMNDPRWIWGEKYIQARHDEQRTTEQKIGVLNKRGWIAYALHGEVLIKKFSVDPDATYTDYGCNNEIYINDQFLEIETLSPLIKLPPGEGAAHREQWLFTQANIGPTEKDFDDDLLPLL